MRTNVLLTLGLVSSVTAGCDQSPPPSRTAPTPTRTQAVHPSTSSASVPSTATNGHAATPVNSTRSAPPPAARVFRTKDELRAALVECGLTNLADPIANVALPGAMLTLTEAADTDLPVGSSKYGGSPDLPASLPPNVRAAIAPLTFIAQLNLSELAPYLKDDSIWPTAGLLSIFLDPANHPANPKLEDKHTIRLVYTQAAEPLSRSTHVASHRSPGTPALPIRRIKAEVAWSLPDFESEVWDRLPDAAKSDRTKLYDFWNHNFRYREHPKHLLAGYAIPEQYDPCSTLREHFQLVIAGQDPLDEKFQGDSALKDRICAADKSEWRLLLQFDLSVDEQLGCCFEHVQFFIGASARSIKDRSFSEAWYYWDQD